MSEIKYFLISNISGGPVTGLSSGFTTTYLADGVAISGSSVAISEIGQGYYQVLVNPVPEGELLLSVKHSSPSNFISPDFHEWTKDSTYTVDDLYGKFLSVGQVPLISQGSLNTLTVTSVVNDDILVDAAIGKSIVSSPFNDGTLSGLTLSMSGASASSPISGYSQIPASVTVISSVDRTVRFEVDRSNMGYDKLDVNGTGTYYFDLEAINSNSKKKTIFRMRVNLIRDYNIN